VEGATIYKVVISNPDGDEVFNIDTGQTVVDVSPDTLETGIRYSWRVRAIGAAGELGSGDAEFVTLSRESVEQRSTFAQGIGSVEPAMRLALMADVDLHLHLLAEACDQFERALRLKPSDPEIKRASVRASEALASARSTP
jgi:GTPase involved in cell partitioning and DNA repair